MLPSQQTLRAMFRAEPSRRPNSGTSQRGFSLIELLIVVGIIGVVAAIAVPNYLATRRQANEAAAISNMRTIGSAEATFRPTLGGGLRFAALDELLQASMIDQALGSATTTATARNSYYYNVTPGTDTYFSGAAATVTPGAGVRRFSSTEAGVIYADTNDPTTMPVATAGTAIGN